MNDALELEQYAQAPQIIASVEFSPEYSKISTKGEPIDASALGVMLSTVDRLSERCRESLSIGKIVDLYALEKGSGISLMKTTENIQFDQAAGVVHWADILPKADIYRDTSIAFVPTRDELFEAMELNPGVLWFGLREQIAASWDPDCNKLAGKSDDEIHAAMMIVMQIVVLLKSHQYPHRRLRLGFESGNIYTWLNQDGDHFMVMTQKQLDSDALAAILHCGDAYVLT